MQCSLEPHELSELKSLRSSAQKAHEVREGTTYETGTGYLPLGDSDTEEVATTRSAPVYQLLLQEEPSKQGTLVFFDVEMTSLQFNTEIVQLAVCCQSASFSHYIMPCTSISPNATKVTGITKEKFCGKDILCKGGKVVGFAHLQTALDDFIEWLKPYSEASGQVLLCAHNAEKFDICILLLTKMSDHVS